MVNKQAYTIGKMAILKQMAVFLSGQLEPDKVRVEPATNMRDLILSLLMILIRMKNVAIRNA